MKQVLTAAGWVHFYTCSPTCGKKEHYNHVEKPGALIVIKPKKNTWEAFKNNLKVKSGYAYQLENYLKSL